MKGVLANTKRLGRYHNLPNNNYNDNSNSQSYFNHLRLNYEGSSKPLLDWNKPLFGNKRTSLQKLLANANKTSERATKFINKIKSRQLACANRVKSIPNTLGIIFQRIKNWVMITVMTIICYKQISPVSPDRLNCSF